MIKDFQLEKVLKRAMKIERWKCFWKNSLLC